MPQALAVVLLLNGVQIDLPAPAVILDGAAWIPLRAVCERKGARVEKQAGGVAVIGRGAQPCLFPVVALSAARADRVAVLLDGRAYVRAKGLAEALGGQCAWRPRARAVSLHLPWLGEEPMRASREEIAKRPLAWRGRLVSVEGRHAGRITDTLSPTVSGQPPADEFFVLAGPRPLYCSTQEFSGAASCPPPLSMLGRSVRVTGIVIIDPRGGVFIKPLEIDLDGGGLAVLRIGSDRLRVAPGEAAVLHLTTGSRRTKAADTTRDRASSLQLVRPDGGTAPVDLDEIALSPGGAQRLTSVLMLRRTGAWRVPTGRAREGIGVWRLRTTPGMEGAERAFLVEAPTSALAPETSHEDPLRR